MKRTLTIISCIALAAVLAFGFSAMSTADDKKPEPVKIEVKKSQTHCPVMGNPVDKTVHHDYDGKRIYFCCKPCIDKFKLDPEGYIKKMEDEGITLEKVGEDHDHDHDHHHDHG